MSVNLLSKAMHTAAQPEVAWYNSDKFAIAITVLIVASLLVFHAFVMNRNRD